jgi:hypothetical protein
VLLLLLLLLLLLWVQGAEWIGWWRPKEGRRWRSCVWDVRECKACAITSTKCAQ